MKNAELKVIAVFKFIRGALALGVSVALFFMWQNSSLDLSGQFPILFKMQSNDPFVGLMMTTLKSIEKEQILLLSILAFSLCILRWIEGIGIWLNRAWAELLAIVSGCLYIPFEAYEILKNYSVVLMLILTLNCLVVIYLGWVLIQKMKAS